MTATRLRRLTLALLACLALPRPAAAAVEVAHSLAQDLAAPVLPPAQRKVLAHWYWFPRSVDNLSHPDYYDCWQTPACEGGAHAGSGGFTQDRPTYRALLTGSWDVTDKGWEVATAKANGIDGFFYDLLDPTIGGAGLGGMVQLNNLVSAAGQAGGGTFKIVPMVDASGIPASSAGAVHAALASVITNPSVMHLADSRPVVGAYMPELWADAAWATALAGLNVAFVPCFQDWQNGYVARVPQTYAEGVWGASDPSGTDTSALAAEAHGQGALFVGPVRPQDARPKDFVYWEPLGPNLMLGQWNQARTNADWAQLITWNDYGEDTQVEPSDGVGSAWLKLSKRYAACFHGACPAFDDELLYFQRKQSTTADPGSSQSQPYTRLGGTVADNRMWLLAYLSSGATLKITCGAATWSVVAAAAGQSTLAAPFTAGCSPVYQLIRGGVVVRQLTGPPTLAAVAYSDLHYHAGTTAP